MVFFLKVILSVSLFILIFAVIIRATTRLNMATDRKKLKEKIKKSPKGLLKRKVTLPSMRIMRVEQILQDLTDILEGDLQELLTNPGLLKPRFNTTIPKNVIDLVGFIDRRNQPTLEETG